MHKIKITKWSGYAVRVTSYELRTGSTLPSRAVGIRRMKKIKNRPDTSGQPAMRDLI